MESRRPPPKSAGSSIRRLARYDFNVNGPPPSLHGHYSTSSLLRGGPPLCVASVLLSSRFNPLVTFPLASTPKVPTFHTTASSRLSPPVCRMPLRSVSRYRRSSSHDLLTTVVLTSSSSFRHVRWFPYGPLPGSHLTQFTSRPFPSPLITTAFDCSNGRWFVSYSCKSVRGACPHQSYSYAKVLTDFCSWRN